MMLLDLRDKGLPGLGGEPGWKLHASMFGDVFVKDAGGYLRELLP